MERLRELVLALDKSPGEFAVQKEILEIAERLDVRVPDQVVQAGQAALKESYGGFGEKVWEIVEQVFLAEIDCHRLVNAKISLRILSRKFPLSKRVYRLSAMLSEAQGDFQKAIEKYDELLRVNDRDTVR